MDDCLPAGVSANVVFIVSGYEYLRYSSTSCEHCDWRRGEERSRMLLLVVPLGGERAGGGGGVHQGEDGDGG